MPICQAYDGKVVFNVSGKYEKETKKFQYAIWGQEITEDLVKRVESEMILNVREPRFWKNLR